MYVASSNVYFTVTQGDDGRPGSYGPPGLRGPKVCLHNLLINETAKVESLISNPLKQDHLPIMEILFVPKIPIFIQFLPPRNGFKIGQKRKHSEPKANLEGAVHTFFSKFIASKTQRRKKITWSK